MSRLNLAKLIELNRIDTEELAKVLYPDVKFPEKSLHRVLKGSSFLDSEQIFLLSKFTGISFNVLFNPESWDHEFSKDKIHIFRKGAYRAELDPSFWELKFWLGDNILHEEYLVNPSISTENLMGLLDQLKDNSDLL